ncbi:MAG: hypothetical protein H6P98_775 [Candidatus Aminicenantes bacterium]|jgi:hypothetical protein|nr:hypothetical protein [Candidatus Aminicenantes bacterium]
MAVPADEARDLTTSVIYVRAPAKSTTPEVLVDLARILTVAATWPIPSAATGRPVGRSLRRETECGAMFDALKNMPFAGGVN